MQHLERANSIAEQKLRDQIDIMKKLCTSEGFYLYWFNSLPDKARFPTNTACFEYVNELHNEFLGYYRYSDYKAFNRYISRRNKQLKNNG